MAVDEQTVAVLGSLAELNIPPEYAASVAENLAGAPAGHRACTGLPRVTGIRFGVGAIAGAVRSRHISAEAATAAAQSVIATREPVLNCFTSLYGESTLNEARALDARIAEGRAARGRPVRGQESL